MGTKRERERNVYLSKQTNNEKAMMMMIMMVTGNVITVMVTMSKQQRHAPIIITYFDKPEYAICNPDIF